MLTYKNKKVAILGLSVEGADSAIFFTREGASVTSCDRRTKEELGETYRRLTPIVSDFRLGGKYLSDLGSYDVLVRTPGMSPRLPELLAAKKNGQVVTSLTQVFFDRCPCPIIGVTGTKGKGTTSSLIYEMLKAAGRRVWLGGNIGTPLLSRVNRMQFSDLVILELSSFQLEGMHASPHVAVVLRITQEHLANFDPQATNFHESKEAYIQAKRSIVRYQKKDDIAVLSMDDPVSRSFEKETKAKPFFFSRSNESADSFVRGQTVYLRHGNSAEKICSSSEIQLLGRHNLENIAAAALASVLAGSTPASIRSAARSFKGLEHRLEFVREVKGVSYYNDSFSTTPETTAAALESFDSSIVLIVGGSEKGSDYSDLGKNIAKARVKTLIVIGVMADRIVRAAKEAGFRGELITGLRTMSHIVRAGAEKAVSGDIVLLSPACASFDMFVNYKQRGKLFKHEVSLL